MIEDINILISDILSNKGRPLPIDCDNSIESPLEDILELSRKNGWNTKYFSVGKTRMFCAIDFKNKVHLHNIFIINENHNDSNFIPQGNYYSLAKVATIKKVSRRTVQQWIDKGWIESIKIDDMGHLIEAKWLDFEPPKPGRKPKE